MRPADELRHVAITLDGVRGAVAGGIAGERRYLLAALDEVREAMVRLEAIVAQTDRPPAGLLVGPVEAPPAHHQQRQVDPPLRVAVPDDPGSGVGKFLAGAAKHAAGGGR